MYVNGDNPPCQQHDCTLGQPETDFDPLDQSSGWTDINAEWFGETTNEANDRPGYSDSRTPFDYTEIKNSSNTWLRVLTENYNVFGTTNPCYYKISRTFGSSSFQIWTTNPQHSCS
jgi:hypothetical protein